MENVIACMDILESTVKLTLDLALITIILIIFAIQMESAKYTIYLNL